MRYIALAILLIGSTWSVAEAQTAPPSPGPSATPAPTETANPLAWQTYITPYAWVPNFNGQLTFQNPTQALPALPAGTANINVHVGPSNYLSHLNFVAMLAAYARRGDLSLAMDYMYANMSSTDATVTTVTGPNGIDEVPVNTSTGTHLRGSFVTIDAGLRLTQNEISPIEIFGGARYTASKASVDWTFTGPLDILPRSGSATRNLNVWDPLIGFRGQLGLGHNWYLPYYIDYGAGSDNTTNQEYVGIAFSQHWGDIVLVNRWLQYYFFSPNINNIQLVGPALAARIRL